ncbi:MAG: response regulator [Chromatiaceae bacterium]|nr:MAG: response regulator [Chromatiaceae bacterium]
MKLRFYILLLLLLFGLAPLIIAVLINLPLVLDRTALFYQKAYLQNLRADFRDLDQHLASRHEMIRLLGKLPEPGIILGEAGSEDQIDLARARYTGWINQMLDDQVDIIEILFVDTDANERFWLDRDAQTRAWHPTVLPPEPPSRGFVNAAVKLQPGEVIVSRIRVNPYAGSSDPRRLMTLQLASPVGERAGSTTIKPLGLLLMTIDVGGLAQFYHDTLWVNHNGSYLHPGEPIGQEPAAFADFPGLADVFADGKLALWRAEERPPFLWVPMFLTEQGVPLWVGRPVDPSPIESFRDALMARVLTIVLALILVVWLIARRLASRAERFGQELTSTVRGILRDGQTRSFPWRGPREVRELGEQLDELARAHAEHLATERKHTQALEQSNRYKSEFLANVSHELRTPLNSILLLSKLLATAESGLDAEQRRQAQVINEAGRDLRTMIDNVLDISRIEAGAVTVSLQWVELRPMLNQLVAMLGPLFADKGLALRLEIAPEAPARLYSDRDKLRQILKNFLSNAAKFTDRGETVISVTGGAAPWPLAIAVSDTGIGIPPGKEEIIFEAFQQADGSTRRRYGGTGLGLSISRELAHLLGGHISVESQLGQGARFTLHLPLRRDPQDLDAVEIIEVQEGGAQRPAALPAAVAASALSAPAEAISAGPPWPRQWGDQWVLLVEREVQSLVAVTAQLEAMGLAVQTAADGEEAVETLTEERDCALLLLGASAAPATTCDTIQRIREEAGFAALPIVIVGEFDADHRRRCRAAGACGFLGKPIDPAALADLVQRLLSAAAEASSRNTA